MTNADVRPAAAAHDGFRPDLEGLRAVAVVLVLLYHAAVPGFAGGYVGVDVFFVLSGFLITGLLLREARRTGTISLPTFYARRARRLLPASALVLLVTVIGAAVMMPPLQVPDVTRDAASAALYVSNFRFALEATDYLQSEMAPSPILHFWSLSVEEQFYVFWPATVLLLARARGDIGRRVGLAAAVISLVSLGLAIWLTVVNQPWAFFSLPTRAWELGLGALLAVGAARLAAIPDRPAAVMAWVGLAMVALSGVLLTAETPFPGIAALLPTVGSALVIAGGFRQPAFAPGRWLAMAVPRFLGRISYSLYLWHWPLLVLPAAALGGPLPWWARGTLVLLAVLLAAATQRWVEDPLRHGRGIGTIPRRNLAMAGALTLVVAVVSLGVGARATSALAGTATTDATVDERELDDILAGLSPSPTVAPTQPGASASPPGPTAAPTAAPATPTSPIDLPATAGGPVPAGLRPALADARDDKPATYLDDCHEPVETTVARRCVYGDAQSPTTVVLFGDSHAASWFPAVERLADERDWRLLNLTKSGCAAVDVSQWNSIFKREYTECDAWRESALQLIEKEKPALVLVANSRVLRVLGDDGVTSLAGAERLDAWQAGAERTLGRLRSAAGAVVLVGDTPRSEFDVPVCLSANRDDLLACATDFDRAVDPAWRDVEAGAAAASGAAFVDPTAWVCPSDPCPPVLGSFMVYRDEHHLATPFARALAGRLESALPDVARAP